MGHLRNFSETIVFCNKSTYYRLFKLFNQSMCSEKLDMMKKANLKKIRLHVCLQYLKYTDQIKSHHCCNKIKLHLEITVQLSPLLIWWVSKTERFNVWYTYLGKSLIPCIVMFEEYFSTQFHSFMTEVPIILKPVQWFVEQINGLVSIW